MSLAYVGGRYVNTYGGYGGGFGGGFGGLFNIAGIPIGVSDYRGHVNVGLPPVGFNAEIGGVNIGGIIGGGYGGYGGGGSYYRATDAEYRYRNMQNFHRFGSRSYDPVETLLAREQAYRRMAANGDEHDDRAMTTHLVDAERTLASLSDKDLTPDQRKQAIGHYYDDMRAMADRDTSKIVLRDDHVLHINDQTRLTVPKDTYAVDALTGTIADQLKLDPAIQKEIKDAQPGWVANPPAPTAGRTAPTPLGNNTPPTLPALPDDGKTVDLRTFTGTPAELMAALVNSKKVIGKDGSEMGPGARLEAAMDQGTAVIGTIPKGLTPDKAAPQYKAALFGNETADQVNTIGNNMSALFANASAAEQEDIRKKQQALGTATGNVFPAFRTDINDKLNPSQTTGSEFGDIFKEFFTWLNEMIDKMSKAAAQDHAANQTGTGTGTGAGDNTTPPPAVTPAPTAAPTPSPAAAPAPTPAAPAPHVPTAVERKQNKEVEHLLANLPFQSGHYYTGAEDGVDGAGQKKAVGAFQGAHGIPVTHEVDQKTLDAIRKDAQDHHVADPYLSPSTVPDVRGGGAHHRGQ